jgi:hypothetical protein
MEELLQGMLKKLAPTYYGKAPQGAARPYIVQNRISGTRQYVNEGQNALAQARVQVDVYAESYTETTRLARRMIANVSGRRVGIIRAIFVDSESDLPAADAEAGILYRRSVDLLVHYTETGV